MIYDSIIIGGGQAGLASGYYLTKYGLNYLILEANTQATGSWSYYYDSLKLFSPARLSSLPGMRMKNDKRGYPTKKDVISYLNTYTKRFKLPILTNQRVYEVSRNQKGFSIETSDGKSYKAKTIINATGSFHNPYLPQMNGMNTFRGNYLHSSSYQKPDQYIGQRVIVVGSGNSAVQIAMELSEVSNTTLAVRKSVQLVKQKILGIDLHYWVKAIGFDKFPFWRFGKAVPIPSSTVDLAGYKEKLEVGNPNQKKMFERFYSDGVVWSEGNQEPVDTVIFATGYRSDFGYLKTIEKFDVEGRPLQKAGISQNTPGLYYVGLEGQRSFSSATLRGGGSDSKFVIKHIKQNL
ncbi:oxidoreductase [Oceanobacillus oncorhynchi subsp. incaldanensis]|uniref:Flavin-containing monooxygenase n=3 Tax=Oceanobacillus TaxID=182709 RepID=A0ABW3NGE0_9BACI|nr:MULTISPECIES: NAD(P)/FAD-dependent oxidoreductase [Bacillaceae]MDM8100603.1 NAD(P)/FAD-dependent oxidoreductase [Oceanobacillus oncorhynchi]GIO17599.1 oxidoreductase [Oceanobacillus oncorhynchi subsp. incaldanensis]CEI82980.1 putative oxidoreductase CzcO [Oceanobacillus oncorhynchi]